MFDRTKIHHHVTNDNQYTVRIGNRVPDGAVNLAYFKNNNANEAGKIMVAKAPTQTIDHINAQTFITKENLLTQDDNAFSSHALYQDAEGYVGNLPLQSISWDVIAAADKRQKTHNVIKEVLAEEIEDAVYLDEADYVGQVYLQNVTYTPVEFDDKEVNQTIYRDRQLKMIQNNLEQPSAVWPDFYTNQMGDTLITDTDGFTGRLAKVQGQEKYNKITSESLGRPVVTTRTVRDKARLPGTFVEDGIVYKLKYVEDVVSDNKYYGVTRVWGNFYRTSDVNGVYGEPMPLGSPYYSENAYVTDDYGVQRWGRGNFAEYYPKVTEGVWRGDSMNLFQQDVSNDGSNMPNRDSYIFDKSVNDEFWMLDTRISVTGHVWADMWIQGEDNAFPPKGYTPVGDNGDIQLNQSAIPNLGMLNAGTFNDPHGRKAYCLDGATIGSAAPPSGKEWFRDVIVFYRADVPAVKGHYVGHEPDGTKNTWQGEQLYQGVLSKEITVLAQTPIKWLAYATYFGTIERDYLTYTGVGFYAGPVSKQLTSGNIAPTYKSEYLLYADDDGFLKADGERVYLDSERFYLAQEFVEDEPLYYKARLKNPIYTPTPPSEYEQYQTDTVQLLTASLNMLPKSYKYCIKLEPYNVDRGLYWVNIHTNFETSESNNVVAQYSCYDIKGDGGHAILINHQEDIKTSQVFIPNFDYKLIKQDAITESYAIQLLKHEEITDKRHLAPFTFTIVAAIYQGDDGLSTYTARQQKAYVVQRQYAYPHELELFDGEYMRISDKTVYDFIIAQNPDFVLDHTKEEIERAIIQLDVEYVDNESNTLWYISDEGYIYVKALEPTGCLNELTGKYDKIVAIDRKVKASADGKLKPQYMVKCRDIQAIELIDVTIEGPLDDWSPALKYGRHSRVVDMGGTNTRLTYLLPEFDKQFFSPVYGKPYMDIVSESALVIDEKTVKTKHIPLLVIEDEHHQPANLSVYKTTSDGVKTYYTIESYSVVDGCIYLADIVNDNDNIQVDYTYEEEVLTYRGFIDEQTNQFNDIDLNPNQYHTFLDTRYTPAIRSNVYQLFNSIVNFFIKPAIIQPLDFNNHPVLEHTVINEAVVYHKFDDDVPNDPTLDLLVGSVYVRHNTSLENITLLDTRTLGGGIVSNISDTLRKQLEPESDYYWDIGCFDGQPYPENNVVVIRIDKRILKENGGKFTDAEVQAIVKKWASVGVICLVEYVSAYKPGACEIQKDVN